MRLPTERTDKRQSFPFPADRERIYETPPTLIWVPHPDGEVHKYTVTVWDGGGRVKFSTVTAQNFAYDTKKWEAGNYTWQVTSDDGAARDVQSFEIAKEAVFFDRPTAEEVLSGIPEERPRQLFSPSDIPALVKARRGAVDALLRTCEVAYADGIPEPPRFHLGEGLPYREYFGRYRDFCDRDLVALSLAYSLLGDERAGRAAVKRLMAICITTPLGPSAVNGPYGDEVGLSNARCLPAVLDMLYPLLDEKARRFVCETVAIYAEQCLARLLASDYKRNPENSHVGRLPAYLGDAAIALHGTGVRDEATLGSWLEFALDVFCGPFPFYGTPDGAWAQGSFYATSYTRWYLPFFSAVERFSGKSLLSRPFYIRFSHYLYHFCHPDYEIHPFGDGYWCRSEDKEWPGFFAQNPFRIYADRFGPSAARELAERLSSPELMLLHLLDAFLPAPHGSGDHPLCSEIGECHHFEQGGLVALHTALGKENDVCLLARATPFPAGSHRHRDQGGFALFLGGVALVTPSGYFGRGYGTRHHFEWTRSTEAHNLPLIDGRGQSDGLSAVGRIIEFDEERREVVMELAEAYADPRLISFRRTLRIDEGGLSLTDEIRASEPVTLDYNLHFLSEPTSKDGELSLERGGALLRIYSPCGESYPFTVTDEYRVPLNEGVPPELAVEMPKQYHASFHRSSAELHRISLRFDTYRSI